MTYEFLLNRLLDRVTEKNPNIDTREGSMIFDALAPEAMELAMAYSALDNVRNETFISTASRAGKLQLCRSQGIDISIFNATHGVFKGVFNAQVELGSRWNLDLYNYEVIDYQGQDQSTKFYIYYLRCETAGSAPNTVLGALSPIANPARAVTSAEIVECVIEGEDEYTDSQIEHYYFNKLSGTSTDGNVAQYEQWCREYPGIGNFKIIPLWNGVNTVKVSILGGSNQIANSKLIEDFQNYLDPGKTGMGDGKAPIGAIVTVSTATEKTINMSAEVSLKAGYSESDITADINRHFSEIAFVKTQVSFLEIASVIYNLPFVESVSNLKLNNAMVDISLGDEEIPVLGTATWTVSA